MKLLTFIQADPFTRLLAITMWAAAFLILVTIIILGLVLIFRRNKRLGQMNYQLRITNHGNLRCHYELQAHDPAKVLLFIFLLNGVELPPSLRHVIVRQEAPAAALPTPHQKQPPAKPRPPAKSAFGQQTRQFGQKTGAIAGILSAVGSLLPRSMGSGAIVAGSKMRQAQAKTTQANRLSSKISNVSGGGTPEIGQARDAKLETGPPPVQPAPSAPTTTGSQQIIKSEGWVQTPYLTPGESVVLELRIKPREIRKSQNYTFKIISRNIEQGESDEQIEYGNIDFKGISWLRSFLPYVGLAALVLVYLMGALSILLTYFRI